MSRFIVPLLTAALFATPLPAQIILTEVMFDPVGSESTDEFIEIYNRSPDKGIDLSGFSIGDQDRQESITFPDSIHSLLPGQYAVVFDRDYIESPQAYAGLIPPEARILSVDDKTLGSAGLSNSTAETIILLDARGDTVAVYTYSLGNAPGHSDEKIDNTGGDDSTNWADSHVLNGTPGKINSVARLAFDLGIDSTSLAWEPEQPRRGETVSLNLVIRNLGRQPLRFDAVELGRDLDGDGALAGNEIEASTGAGSSIAPGDSQHVVLQWLPVQSGFFNLVLQARAAPDERLQNNRLAFELPVGYLPGDLVVNEIMAAPVSGAPEWIEVVNPGLETVALLAWRLGDAQAESAPVADTMFVAPGEYAVLARDSLSVPAGAAGIRVKNWPALGNDADRVRLMDFYQTPIDSLSYRFPTEAEAGVSLERINPALPATDAANWALCVAPAGSTPGWQNSVYAEVLPAQTTLEAAPNPFSPNADGQDDRTVIRYALPMPSSRVDLVIYDLKGRLVRRLLNNAPCGAEGFAIWDGRADDGRRLDMGIYIIWLEAIDAANGKLLRARTTVVLAQRL